LTSLCLCGIVVLIKPKGLESMKGNKMFTVKSGNIAVAKCADIEAASLIVTTFYPEDGKIFKGNSLVWTEGKDGTASDSYDSTADIVYSRMDKLAQIKKIKNS